MFFFTRIIKVRCVLQSLKISRSQMPDMTLFHGLIWRYYYGYGIFTLIAICKTDYMLLPHLLLLFIFRLL